jgi:predicted lipoprotein
MRKGIKYFLWIAAILIVAYNAVYFRKLSDVNAGTAKAFDAAAYANNYFYKQLPAAIAKAPDVDKLIEMIKTDTAATFKIYGHTLAIGTTRYFLVQGKGTIINADENGVEVSTPSGNSVLLTTEYVYGNALRDASGLVDINKFSNTMDLNNISAEVDRLVRAKVLPAVKPQLKKGSKILFSGAVGLNQAHLQLEDIEITPVSLKIIP